MVHINSYILSVTNVSRQPGIRGPKRSLKNMTITRLTKTDFWDKYLPLCKPFEGLPEAEEQNISKAIDALDAKIREALKDYDDEEDFQLSDDWNPCWHHSGGIYGKPAFTRQFLDAIYEVLAEETHPWCFHLTCEPDFEGMEDGQLFIYQGDVFADASDDLDYGTFESK